MDQGGQNVKWQRDLANSNGHVYEDTERHWLISGKHRIRRCVCTMPAQLRVMRSRQHCDFMN